MYQSTRARNTASVTYFLPSSLEVMYALSAIFAGTDGWICEKQATSPWRDSHRIPYSPTPTQSSAFSRSWRRQYSPGTGTLEGESELEGAIARKWSTRLHLARWGLWLGETRKPPSLSPSAAKSSGPRLSRPTTTFATHTTVHSLNPMDA
jgi:hypothetical protein